MYWSEANSGDIRRANLDGTSQEILISGLSTPVGIALDLSVPVPEPPTLLLVGIGTMALVGYTWRQKRKPA
jgi:hypothetical protein